MATYDCNDIPSNERMAISYARGVALSIFDWVWSHCEVIGPDGNIVVDLPSQFLIQIVKTLINYKVKAMQLKLKGASQCDTRSLWKQVANVLKCDNLLEIMWQNSDSICDNSLEFKNRDGYSVNVKDIPAGSITDSCKRFSGWMSTALTFTRSPIFAKGDDTIRHQISARQGISVGHWNEPEDKQNKVRPFKKLRQWHHRTVLVLIMYIYCAVQILWRGMNPMNKQLWSGNWIK